MTFISGGGRRSGGTPRREQAAHIDHLVRMNFVEEALKATAAGPLLRDKGDCCGAGEFSFVELRGRQQIHERNASEVITDAGCGVLGGSKLIVVVGQGDRVEEVNAG